MRKRFDIVVFNYKRIDSFFANFYKVTGFDPARDRITIVSCSPSEEESASLERFTRSTGIPLRYLLRENRGIDQLARAQYFGGEVGSLAENTEYEFIFQMQDHYLDTSSSFSRYGPPLNGQIKGDVVPDGAAFALDRIEKLAGDESVSALFNDRLNPCWFQIGKSTYVAPCGGNFIIRSKEILDDDKQVMIRDLMQSCDDTYNWAVFAEFMWGYIFFREGNRYYDLKRERVYTSFPRQDFYLHGGPANSRFRVLARRYRSALRLQVSPFGIDLVMEKVKEGVGSLWARLKKGSPPTITH